MTKQDYSSKVLGAPTGNLLVGDDNAPAPSISFNTRDAGEIAEFTEDGFYYKGEFVDDAGEVHRLMKDVLNGICYKQLCVELHDAFNTYAVDQSHHELLERARAALND